MDAILVCGETQNEHDKNLTAALTRIQEADFTLNKEKCKFNKTAIKFLGQVVDKSYKSHASTKNITELMRFLVLPCNI